MLTMNENKYFFFFLKDQWVNHIRCDFHSRFIMISSWFFFWKDEELHFLKNKLMEIGPLLPHNCPLPQTYLLICIFFRKVRAASQALMFLVNTEVLHLGFLFPTLSPNLYLFSTESPSTIPTFNNLHLGLLFPTLLTIPSSTNILDLD